MKKILLLLLLAPYSLLAQVVANGNFENWNSVGYDRLTGWFNSNEESIARCGTLSAFPTSDSHSGQAIRISTVSCAGEIICGYLINTNGDPIAGEGGFPYSDIPTALTGYYKYNLQGNDTALMMVIFKSGGSIINIDVFKIRGSGQQNTYVPFTFPLTLTTQPDSVIIAIASSNIILGQGLEAGSTLWVDDLTFTGSGTLAPITNGQMDNWTTDTINMLTGWNCPRLDQGIQRTTDSYAGNYALLLQSYINENNQPSVQNITSGSYGMNEPVGGRPYSLNKDTLSGYYKYFNTSGDRATVSVSFYNQGVSIGGYFIYLDPVPVYTQFEIPIDLGLTPDTMRIDITSSEYPFNNVGAGSSLFLDEIELASAPLSFIWSSYFSDHNLEVFPNPASDFVNVKIQKALNNATLGLYNNIGELVISKRITGEPSMIIDVSQLPKGLYILKLQNTEVLTTKCVILQ